ncbi:MAG: carbohydrate ABC transporter permease [Spirochaetaceae bacterium]|jgi:multiple sugar transport system permease protein|nr:carbohydrate ABC transporter permease [Spirochaetaceae bacterium]
MKKAQAAEWCVVYLVCAGVLMMVVVPLLFFFTTAFSSVRDFENGMSRMLPNMNVGLKVTWVAEERAYRLEYQGKDGYKPAMTSGDMDDIRRYLLDILSVSMTEDAIAQKMEPAKTGNAPIEIVLKKDVLRNFVVFFKVTNKAEEAFVNSIVVVLLTILISVTFGSLAGYAIARYKFMLKDQINIMLLVVRMFPMVGISIPLAGILIKLNLYDTMLGLAILYALPNIALTSWITSSIFLGIGRELEEASLVFGANSIQTFLRITFPLAVPAIAASSMYAFLTAWNDTLSALILTSNHPTLALSVYQSVGSNMTSFQYSAAGGVILVIPALVFTFIVRRYVSNMWGSVSL